MPTSTPTTPPAPARAPAPALAPADAHWHAWNQSRLEPAYLAADNPRGQSGFSRDATRWENARRVITQGIERDGTLLDVGCASGLLLEDLQRWCAADGVRLEPYGLDLAPGMVMLAQQRLPHWQSRIAHGNSIDWTPPPGTPQRFDYVRTELCYVPPWRERAYVARLLRDLVAPGGRLLLCAYGSGRRALPRAMDVSGHLRAWGFPVAGSAIAHDPDSGRVVTRVLWIERDRVVPDAQQRHGPAHG